MGYRSDVTAVFYVNEAKHFPVLKLWLDENFPVKESGNYIRWFNRGMIFEEENTKWYGDYEEVKAFNGAVEKFTDLIYMDTSGNEDAPKFSYEFVRIGEEYDDIETSWEGHHCEYILGVSRSVTIDV